MLIFTLLLLWAATAQPVTLDWRMIFMVAVPLLLGGLVALGVMAVVMLKVIRGGEKEWMELFGRAIQTDAFRTAVNAMRTPKEEEFRRLIEKSDEASIRLHDNDETAHRQIRHYFITEIQALKDSYKDIRRLIDK